MKVFQLYREKGLIVFNSFNGEEIFWLSYQAAAQGGGAMYDQIKRLEFENVINNIVNISELYRAVKPRTYDPHYEKKQEEIYGLNEVIKMHNLKQYLGQKIVNSKIEI